MCGHVWLVTLFAFRTKAFLCFLANYIFASLHCRFSVLTHLFVFTNFSFAKHQVSFLRHGGVLLPDCRVPDASVAGYQQANGYYLRNYSGLWCQNRERSLGVDFQPSDLGYLWSRQLSKPFRNHASVYWPAPRNKIP
jgi:hypothetical protein